MTDPEPSSDLPTAGDLLRAFAAPAKKALGQHFLVDPSILSRIVALGRLQPGDAVLEIGPGPGTLTRTLLAQGCRVVAVELDDRAAAFLPLQLSSAHLRVIHADALAIDLAALPEAPVAVLANLPYNSATEIFFKIENIQTFSRMILMFQREVALRFVAPPGGKDSGPLALLSAIRWQSRIGLKLPPGAFLPPPRVHSAVVVFERRPSPAVPPDVEGVFRDLVRTAFQQRRKTLKNALASRLTGAQIEGAGIDSRRRPETLALVDFLRLAEV